MAGNAYKFDMKGEEFHFSLSDFPDLQAELVLYYQKNFGLFVHTSEDAGDNNYSS